MRENFFKHYTPESCYWAGFIAADGNIVRGKTKHALRIGINLSDGKHLDHFHKLLSNETEIKQYPLSNPRLAWSYTGSKQIVDDLEDNFNIKERKSLTLRHPPIQNQDQSRHFIRGLLDGDGSIHSSFHTNYYKDKKYRYKQWIVTFNGTHSVIEWVRSQIKNHVVNIKNPSTLKCRSIYRVMYAGKQCKSLLLWLYINSSTNTRLQRKYSLANQLIEYYNEGEDHGKCAIFSV